MQMKIIITGSAGFIGMHISQELLDLGHEVWGLDNFNDYYQPELKQNRIQAIKKNKLFKSIEIDINDIEKLNLENQNFDICINLAAQAGVRLPISSIDKYVSSNITGFKAVINFCKKNNIKNLVYASSSSVYSGNNKVPFSENDALLNPTSFYAYTKIYNEHLAKSAELDFGLKSFGLRFFTVYGEWGRPDMAYFNFLRKILCKEEITIFNDGELFRDMTYISDIAIGVKKLVDKIEANEISTSEILNLGNDKPISVLRLVNKLETLTKKKALIKSIEKNDEIKKTHADISKAKKMIEYNPSVEFDEGIVRFYYWFKKHYGL